MLNFFLKFCKGGQKCCRAVGRTDGCASAENMVAKGLGSKAGTSAKVRSRVCGWIGRSDRRFEGNRREQVVGFWRTQVGGPRV